MAQPAEDDALQALRDRVRATQDAVERLATETRAAAEQPGGTRQARHEGVPDASEQTTGELQALVALVEMLRGLLPAELQAQLTELVRQLLLLVRGILDWWIDRIDSRPPAPAVEVEDIEVG